MTRYVVDDLALIAGLVETGSELHRRELSRLLHGAAIGGPTVDVPALCLTAAAMVRPALADHLAGFIAAAPPGTIGVCGLGRTATLDVLRASYPRLGWPATHAAARALATGALVVTAGPDRYADAEVDILPL